MSSVQDLDNNEVTEKNVVEAVVDAINKQGLCDGESARTAQSKGFGTQINVGTSPIIFPNVNEPIPKSQRLKHEGLPNSEPQKRTRLDSTSSSSFSLFDYIYGELRRGYMLENDEQRYAERREKFYVFMKIPRELERFILYGFFQCADAFLFVFTFLPLRFMLSIWFLVNRSFKFFFSLHNSPCHSARKILQPAEICDLLKGIILIVVSIMMLSVDTSMLYHIVKSQSVIKLYIFFNMLEIADRLFSSFGQDILDALFWTATEPRGRKREHLGLLPHLMMAIGYVFLHTLLVLFQATTLNVAINSQNKALLTIMMSNNFVELKGMVFKKFGKNNLFQMSCSDVRERFHYLVLLLIVVIQTMKEYNWTEDHFWVLLPDIILVLIAEMLVDWVKHAFITRFNEISYEVYRDYTVSLAYDLASSKLKNAYSDHSDLVSRRMAFIPLPLGALVFRVMVGSVTIGGFGGVISLIMLYLCLVALKVLNNIILLGKACDLIDEHRQLLKDKMPQPRQTTSLPSSRHHSMEDLRLAKLNKTKSVPHSPNVSLSSSLQDISAQAEILQEMMEPKPIFNNSTVSINSLGLTTMAKTDAAFDEYLKSARTSGIGLSHQMSDPGLRRVSFDERPLLRERVLRANDPLNSSEDM